MKYQCCYQTWNTSAVITVLYFQCGLVVVDSPGIGENAEMDKVVMNFVCEQEINAFIYAIKSDNAGGVDEDRVCS